MKYFKISIEEKGINEILHFTTNKGVLGSLKTWSLLPNSQLSSEDTLSFIFQQNSLERKERDKKWLDYVNLSITKLNFEFFNYSQYVHRDSDLYWAIFSFDPEILTHNGVIFTTTNNIYPSCLRGAGLSGFEAVFNESILGKYQKKVIRTANHLPSWTTCQQSEVLYYGPLSLDYLSKIYVCDFESKYSIAAQIRALGIKKTIQIEVCPTMFEGV
jgi:hypothetical protein